MTDDRKKTHLIVTGRGGGSGEQVQADWSQTDSEQPDYIKNKPELATVATSGSYNDLTDKPTIPAQAQADWNETDTADPSYIQNKPTIPAAQVNADWNAVSGVAQILNKPSIPAAQIQSDWNQSDNTQADYIKNKPTILTQWFGTQQEYDAILVKDPNVIYNIEGSDNVQADWNQSDSSADDYIKNKPTIPAAQVNSDWNANSGVAQILNKPTIPAAQVNSDWNAVSGVAQILNKPTIPTVPPMNIETVRFTMQGGVIRSVDFYVMPQENNYFYVEDVSGSNNTLSIDPDGSFDLPIFEVFKSTDQVNWTSMGTTGTLMTAQIPTNGRLYLKAVTDSWVSGFEGSIIYASGNHNFGGNIMSLLYGDNFRGQTTFPEYSQGNFMSLFGNDTTLISAENLVLPATTLAPLCYNGMFNNCYNMVKAPTLPATTLANDCYNFMFHACTALTTAPVLPATTLADYCYSSMFWECDHLNTVITYAQDISAEDCLGSWLDTVAATGDFYNLGGATYTSGASGIPSGWTVHTSL